MEILKRCNLRDIESDVIELHVVRGHSKGECKIEKSKILEKEIVLGKRPLKNKVQLFNFSNGSQTSSVIIQLCIWFTNLT